MYFTAFRLKFNHFRQPLAFDNYSPEPTLYNFRFQFATVEDIIFGETCCVSCADFVSPRKDNCGQFSSCCRCCWERTCLYRLAPTEDGRRMLNAFGICFGLSTYGDRERQAHASWSICVTLCDFNFFFDSACFQTTSENTERDSFNARCFLLSRLPASFLQKVHANSFEFRLHGKLVF